MDTSEAKAIVDREIEPLMLRLGIPHWQITVVYDRFPDSQPNTRGQVSYNVDYNRATIQIDPDRADDAADLRSILLHELFHVLLTPFQLVERMLETLTEGDDRAAKLYAQVNAFAYEKTVINLQRMFAGLTGQRDGGPIISAAVPPNPVIKVKAPKRARRKP